MTIHVFYLIQTKFGYKMDSPVIYAATDNEMLAKIFISTRNMDLFYYKKIKCNRKESVKLMDKMRGSILTETTFMTKSDYGKKAVDVVVTWEEETNVLISSQDIYLDSLVPTLMNPDIFSEDSKTILKSIEYTKLWKIYREKEDLAFTDFSELALVYDELSIFIKSYGWTLKM